MPGRPAWVACGTLTAGFAGIFCQSKLCGLHIRICASSHLSICVCEVHSSQLAVQPWGVCLGLLVGGVSACRHISCNQPCYFSRTVTVNALHECLMLRCFMESHMCVLPCWGA
jgi:hypothetical protein